MKREHKILRHIDKNGLGIEIGPSHNPVAPKKEGYKVQIIDHVSREELIKKYKDGPVFPEKIEEVDFVWNGRQSYSELTGTKYYYDWIIASHMIEHTPDLIGFLNECDSILKDDGVISLVVPDKRYCFDHYRPLTGISKIIDCHLQRNTITSPGTAAEFFLTYVSRDGNPSWDVKSNDGQFDFKYSLDEAIKNMNSIIYGGSYVDLHSWCFVPHSFRLIIHDLYSLGFIRFKEVDFFPTEGGCEFYITLSRTGKGIEKSRIEMLDEIEAEISEGIVFSKEYRRSVEPKRTSFLSRILKQYRAVRS